LWLISMKLDALPPRLESSTGLNCVIIYTYASRGVIGE
jgi:hypothetical protein